MKTDSKHVLVVGATQGTGLHVVKQLLEQGDQVSVLARDPSKAARVFAGFRVQIINGDVTQPHTLNGIFKTIDSVIYTIGVTKRPAPESLIKSVEYNGLKQFIDAARTSHFQGRLIYMTTIGIGQRSFAGELLNLIKGKTLIWRARAEGFMRESQIPYTIVRAGLLNDQAAKTHQIIIDQQPRGASMSYKVSRADVARVLVAALDNPKTINKTFNLYWGQPAAEGGNAGFSLTFDELVTNS